MSTADVYVIEERLKKMKAYHSELITKKKHERQDLKPLEANMSRLKGWLKQLKK